VFRVRVEGSGFRVNGLGFRIWDSGLLFQGLRFFVLCFEYELRIQGLGLTVLGLVLRARAEGSGFRVQS
jgi:hypothetical protein